MRKKTHFRWWVENLWLENCEEHFQYGEPKYSLSEYFNKFKYWLKREYRYQSQNDFKGR